MQMAGTAAQAAIGGGTSMGNRVHPVNLVKVGVDGMEVDEIGEVFTEVVVKLHITEHLSHCEVMSGSIPPESSILWICTQEEIGRRSQGSR